MPLTELQKQIVDLHLGKLCKTRIPAHVQDKVRLEYDIKGNSVTLLECRPNYMDKTADWTRRPFAKIKYELKTTTWLLYCYNSNLKACRFDPLAPQKSFEKVVQEIILDRTGIFWG